MELRKWAGARGRSERQGGFFSDGRNDSGFCARENDLVERGKQMVPER